VLELAALAGARVRSSVGSGNGNGHSAGAGDESPAAPKNGSRQQLDPDLLQVELAFERFRASGSKVEDFLVEE